MKISEDPVYCSLPYTSAQIKPGGLVWPCNRFIFEGDNTPPAAMNIFHNDLNDILHNEPRMQKLRANIKSSNRDSGCTKCFEEEDANKGTSIRKIYNQNNHILDGFDPYKVELRWIEFAVSNICNLKCRMCTPLLSFPLKREWEELFGRSSPHWKLHKASDVDLEKFITPSLRHIKFTGGEPLLVPEYKEVLRLVVQKLDPSKIFLNYSTNLMVGPDSELIELWKQFKYVEFSMSFDGTKDFIEYQRYPTKWGTIENNLRLFLELHKEFDARIGNRATYTVYNILNLREMTDYWINAVNEFGKKPFNEYSWFNPTHAHIPPQLSITILPKELKSHVADYLLSRPSKWQKVNRSRNHFVEYMNSEENQDRIEKFKSFTMALDENRGQSFTELCPQFSCLMD